MIDIEILRKNLKAFQDAATQKGIECDIHYVLTFDQKNRTTKVTLDNLRSQQNEISNKIAKYKKSGDKCEELFEKSSILKSKIRQLEDEYRATSDDLNKLLLTVPQIPSPQSPLNVDVEIKRVGEIPYFDFEPKDHITLMKELDMIDIERAVKISGSRHYILKGRGAFLHQAVLRLAMDLMIKKGFTQLHVPVLVKDKTMTGTGYYPGGEEQAFRCERDNMSLAGTAEVPLTAYHSGEILDVATLPRKYVAVSPCFRREAGAAGKDAYGLYRVHCFEKVEQVILCKENDAESLHNEILKNAEEILTLLELPYRVLDICVKEMGQGKVRQFDIETWMPSRKNYGETHSASSFGEFQARRLNLKYRDGNKIKFCNTLNNTVIASPRILISLVECHQQKDGSIRIPDALQTYMSY